MSRPNNGGPAFPNKGDNTPGHEIYDGMSLRAYPLLQRFTLKKDTRHPKQPQSLSKF